MWTGGYIPKPVAPLPIGLENPVLLKGAFNDFSSLEAKQNYDKFVESLSKVFGLSNDNKNTKDSIFEFFGESVKSVFDTSGAMDKSDRLNLSSGGQAQSSTVNLPAGLKGKNLQTILTNGDYKVLPIEDGIALLQAIKEAVEGIDQSSSKIQDLLKNNDCSWFNDFGAYNSALFGFLMEAVQDMPSQVKGIFTPGNDFYKWAMKTLDDHEKDCKKNNKSTSIDVAAFKNEWKGFAAKMDNLDNMDVNGVRSLSNKPLMAAGISVNMLNTTRSGQFRKEMADYKQNKEKMDERVREDNKIEQERIQRARAARKKSRAA